MKGGKAVSLSDKTPRKVDEAMIDKLAEEAKQAKNLKEQIYDKINVPIWLLDVIIAVSVAALFYIIVFKRN